MAEVKVNTRVASFGSEEGAATFSRGRAPVRTRLAIALLVVLPVGAYIAPSAVANAQGGHELRAVDCPDTLCNLRMTSADFTRSSYSWSVPSSHFEYTYIAAF